MSNYARAEKLVSDLSSAAKCGDVSETERLRKLLNDLRSEAPKCQNPDVNQVIAGYSSDLNLAIDVHNSIANVLDRFHEVHLMTLVEGDHKDAMESVVISILEEVILVRSYILSPRFVEFIEESLNGDSTRMCAGMATRLENLHMSLGEPDHAAKRSEVETQLDELKIAILRTESFKPLLEYSVADLAKACTVSKATLSKYGKDAVQSWPGQGEGNWLFSNADARKIVAAVHDGSRNADVKRACNDWLKLNKSKTKAQFEQKSKTKAQRLSMQ